MDKEQGSAMVSVWTESHGRDMVREALTLVHDVVLREGLLMWAR